MGRGEGISYNDDGSKQVAEGTEDVVQAEMTKTTEA
jgi:hypothetical protein